MTALEAALAKFLPRCRIDEDTGCATWTGAYSFDVCKAQIKGEDGKLKMVNIRRFILEAKIGRPLGKLLASCRCGNGRCIEPSHLVALSRAALQQRSSKEGLFSSPAARAARLAAGRKAAKVTDEIAQEIRSSAAAGETHVSIAKRLELHPSTIGRVVRLQIGAETVSGASVFSWRPAA